MHARKAAVLEECVILRRNYKKYKTKYMQERFDNGDGDDNEKKNLYRLLNLKSKILQLVSF